MKTLDRVRFTIVLTSLLMAGAVVILPMTAHADIVMTGVRDNSGTTGPRWAASTYTATAGGPATITLDWEGDGALSIAIRDAATGRWLASDTSANRPKVLTLDLAAGAGYRIAVWATSGAGSFTVDVDDGTTTTTTTTTMPPGEPTACGFSNGFDLCLHVASDTLTGNAEVWVTFNGASDVFALEFAWGSTPDATDDLLTDFHAPWTWSWPTQRYLDGTGFLIVRAEKPAGATGAPVALQVTLANGNVTSFPQNPLDWETRFAPRPQAGTDPLIVAVGDGADGGQTTLDVANSIAASDAEMMLFLGDMYERGTPAEWEVNFGLADFDDPGGGTGWGQLASYTQPTLGNHEAWHVDVWRDYWHGRPDWDAFSYGGVFFLNLNSECDTAGGCDVGSPQYVFAEAALQAATESCIVAMWHRPVISAVSNATIMEPLWDLVASHGGDLVLNGHTHDMEATVPLNGYLQAGQPDSHMVQLVSGAGGHNMVGTLATDPRTAWQATKMPGAAYITLVDAHTGDATAIAWEFRDTAGSVIGPGATGTVDCGAPVEPDTMAPSVPGQPLGTSTVPGTIDLTWEASTDDRATTIEYLVYRDGSPSTVGSVFSESTSTVAYTDTGLAAGNTHTYTIVASDGSNQSAPSIASDPITVAEDPDPGVLIVDAFDAGLGLWSTVSNTTIDGSVGAGAPPSALVGATNARAFLRSTLSEAQDAVCASVAIQIDTQIGNVSLLRLRGADSGIARVYRRANGQLWIRSDASGDQTNAGVTMPAGTWVSIELCASVATGELSLAIDDVPTSTWNADFGTTPIQVIQLGDNGNKTWGAWYDDVTVIADSP